MYLALKRTLDIALCIAVLPFVLVILAACWIAIKLDSPGPGMFSHLRTGKKGKKGKR